MKIVTDVREANYLLQSYIGGILQIAFYSESLKRIAIRICQPDLEEVIYFIGIGCESISGRFRLSNVDMLIVQEVDEETKDSVVKIRDKRLGFELSTTGGFSLAQGFESEFGTSFDSFIIEKR